MSKANAVKVEEEEDSDLDESSDDFVFDPIAKKPNYVPFSIQHSI